MQFDYIFQEKNKAGDFWFGSPDLNLLFWWFLPQFPNWISAALSNKYEKLRTPQNINKYGKYFYILRQSEFEKSHEIR